MSQAPKTCKVLRILQLRKMMVKERKEELNERGREKKRGPCNNHLTFQ
jgi:hypothetical protein